MASRLYRSHWAVPMNIRPTSLNIGAAQVSVAEEILRLQRIAYRSEAELYNDYSIPPLTQTVEDMEADFRRHLILKAEVDGRIVGSVRGYQSEGSCFIGRLIVHPDFQRRGIGTRLMNEIESHFRDSARFELFTGHEAPSELMRDVIKRATAAARY